MSDTLRYPVPIAPEDLEGEHHEEEGPLGWFRPQMVVGHSLVRSMAKAPPPAALAVESLAEAAEPVAIAAGDAAVDDGTGLTLAPAPAMEWRDVLIEYRRRQAQAARPAALGPADLSPGGPAPVVPGGRNWFALGPTVVLEGQTVGHQPVAGRVSGIAVSEGAQAIYAATANGGVFRSDDGASTWRSLMDGFDLDPTSFASASLVCGAIAIDPADPARVYVGTGEGDTHEMFSRRVTSALPAYRGVGPVRTDDGGVHWISEASTPDLAGHAFFALAVDPGNRENVVGATSNGLYQRTFDAQGEPAWIRRREGVFSSVVVTRDAGVTRFFAAEWGSGVVQSDDGETWNRLDTGFPDDDVGRITLAVQPEIGEQVHAFVAGDGGGARGLYRLDDLQSSWRSIEGLPPVLPGGQGDYDLALAVDPTDRDVVYLGGDFAEVQPFPGSVWRCTIEESAGGGLEITSTRSIGTHAHADVHVLVHTPDEPHELWCGGDGGIFLNRDPRGTGEFVSQNSGLSCLCTNFLGQHPTDPSILFVGLQDNGTARTDAGPIWSRVWHGDGGYCVVNWNDPDRVLVFGNGRVIVSDSGGGDLTAWTSAWSFPWVTMTLPIVTPPFDPANPSAADVVAVAAGNQVSISDDFAGSWSGGVALSSADGAVFALAFAGPDRLFIGTTRGRVFRADRGDQGWTATRLDDAAAGPLGVEGLVTDVAVDWDDPDHESIYLSFGGVGSVARVWHFDGARWRERSGSGNTSLLPVEHTSLAVDPAAPRNVYVGATIGVWHSEDGGATWNLLQNGLPDAPVFDLQIHPTRRLLRAATHGRGVYEIELS